MRVYEGIISKIVDPETFEVEITVKGLFKGMRAYAYDLSDQPEIGDPVLVKELDSEMLGQTLIYQKLRTGTKTRLSIGDNKIEIDQGGIVISTPAGAVSIDNTNIEVYAETNLKLIAPKIDITGALTINGIPYKD